MQLMSEAPMRSLKVERLGQHGLVRFDHSIKLLERLDVMKHGRQTPQLLQGHAASRHGDLGVQYDVTLCNSPGRDTATHNQHRNLPILLTPLQPSDTTPSLSLPAEVSVV